MVRYRLLDATGQPLISEPITATGGNDNEVESYAVRGALTNAIGAAFAKLTWQLPVYKGQLSHRNAATFGENGNGKKPAGTTVKATATRSSPPAAEPSAPASTANGDGPDLSQFEIKLGKHAGKKFGEVSSQAIQWYAESMNATTPAAEELRDAAKAYLAHLADSRARLSQRSRGGRLRSSPITVSGLPLRRGRPERCFPVSPLRQPESTRSLRPLRVTRKIRNG